MSELDKGQAEGKLMIIAAHIPLALMAFPPTTNSAVSKTQLLTKLSAYPNLILWVAGHRHRSVITPRPSIDPAHSGPEYGFREVETPSLRDFPQQFRTFDIVRNSDNTISIFATDVDPAVKEGSPAAISRSYAIAAQLIFGYKLEPSPFGTYNAELVKQLPRDTMNPTVQISSPTSTSSITRNCPTLALSGSASDNTAVVSVTWANSRTGKTGSCILDNTSWSANSINLETGNNPINITASDAAGNTAVASIAVIYVNTVPGDAWKGLAMVSLPIIPDQTDPKIEARFYRNNWWSFLTNQNNYSGYPDSQCWLQPAAETPGRGFWARFQSAAIPYGTIPSQDKPSSIHLQPGWNLVGNPFISDVKWDTNALTVQVSGAAAIPLKDAADVVCNFAWGWKQNSADPYKGSYYPVYDSAPNDKLEPWRGYWIKAFKECDLIIPAP